MATLTIRCGQNTQRETFTPPARLDELLTRCGCMSSRPCGGRGQCGKCAVALSGACAPPDAAEARFGVRLACRALLTGDCEVVLPPPAVFHAETAAPVLLPDEPLPGAVGAAVDIGTTTIAMTLYDLGTGRPLGSASMLNPQTAVSADVTGRISAALTGDGPLLRDMLLTALTRLMASACDARFPPEAIETMVVAGNTTMLALLTGSDVHPLAAWPFDGAPRFGEWTQVLGRRTYLPRCISAFAGADVTCGLLASGITDASRTALYVDVGTNGEMALWHEDRLTVCAAPAGPAFEGAGISCGCGSIPGAIDRVWVEHGRPAVRTIDKAPPVGVCGSGLIDAAACFLRLGWIDPHGGMEGDSLPLAGSVSLRPQDVRALQLAKAAIAAGLRRLTEAAGASWADVSATLLAGGFGQHLSPASAAAIGMLPAPLAARTRAVGNAALAGAAMLLLQPRCIPKAVSIADRAAWLPLSGDPGFERYFLQAIDFPG